MDFGHQPGLSTETVVVMSAYLRGVDAKLPDRVCGLYLVGSVALNDYQSGQSDIDFVSVTETALTPLELEQLERFHKELRRHAPRPKLDGVYVTESELRVDPTGLSVPYCLDDRFASSGGFNANPVTWATMHRHPVTLRGPTQPVVWYDEQRLRGWCRENLQSYWVGWVHAARTHWGRKIFSLTRQAAVWGALGVTRLHATIRTGAILSKSAAGNYALEVFPPHWSEIIQDALGSRLGASGSSHRNIFARRRDTLTFMEYVIADALKR